MLAGGSRPASLAEKNLHFSVNIDIYVLEDRSPTFFGNRFYLPSIDPGRQLMPYIRLLNRSRAPYSPELLEAISKTKDQVLLNEH